jgi:signal transduction histidine kinase
VGAFTQKRLRILSILLTQIVISIENSRLYEKLRNEVRKQVLSARKIQAHQTQLRKLSSQLAKTEDRERKAIADDLHDSVTQTMALSISMLKSIHDLSSRENTRKMNQTKCLLEQSLSSIRSLTFQLSPPILYDVGLEAALQWLCEDFFEKYGVMVRLVNTCEIVTPLDETTKICLYRAVRELIMNILKHARTKSAVLTLSNEKASYVICMADTGVGFDVSKMNIREGFGLFSISERLRALNGKIQIDSSPGKGTRVQLEVPLNTHLIG